MPNEPAIQTTIDGRLQEAAEQITRRNAQAFGEKVSVAALVVSNRTGEVLAHVGSAGYFDETRLGAIDMTAAIRSPGSALKPFIYGLAFEDGLAHPETLIEDKPVRFDTYAPANFDAAFHGTVTVRTALQLSLNVPAVKVLNEVGPVKLAARFRDAGMPFPVPRNLTVALGGVGLSLENLTGLYLALARGGSAIPIHYQNGNSGPVWNAPDAPVLLQPAAAWYVTDILRGAPVPASATPGAIAFKTGTSYGFRDAWAAGFDGDYTIAVWVGLPDATAVPGLVGLRVAAPVMFELFGSIGPHRAPFAGAPANVIGVRKTQDLPPPLRAFHEQKRDTAGWAGTRGALAHRLSPRERGGRIGRGGRGGGKAPRCAQGRGRQAAAHLARGWHAAAILAAPARCVPQAVRAGLRANHRRRFGRPLGPHANPAPLNPFTQSLSAFDGIKSGRARASCPRRRASMSAKITVLRYTYHGFPPSRERRRGLAAEPRSVCEYPPSGAGTRTFAAVTKAGSKFLFYRAYLPQNRFTLRGRHRNLLEPASPATGLPR